MGLRPPPEKPEIYGHRGSRLRRADNTIDSFRLAIEEGANGVETDVRLLADGSLVLFNPDMVGTRLTSSLTIDELEAHVASGVARPRDLAALPVEARLILEVKQRGCEEKLAEEVSSLSSVVICSFDHRVVAELAAIRASTGAAFELGVTITGHIIDGPTYVRELGAEWFFPAGSFVDRETVDAFDEGGIAVVPWVLNHELQWRAATEWGCHGFITDDPLRAFRWFSSSGARPA